MTLAEYIEANKSDLEYYFGDEDADTVTISARGNALVCTNKVDLNDPEFGLGPEDIEFFKEFMQEFLNALDSSAFDDDIAEIQKEVPSADSVILEFCDQNGDVFATRKFTKK